MKCSQCSIEINKEFKAALSSNKCPACGGRIIESNSLASFVPLCELLNKHISDDDALKAIIETIATEIITEFDVCPKGTKQVVVKAKIDNNNDDSDEAHKRRQISQSRDMLSKLRQEAYEDALRGQFGMGETSDEEDADKPSLSIPPLSEDEMSEGEKMLETKRRESQQNVLNGTSGAFRRSS